MLLFGSLAREDYTLRSDADILVLVAGPRADPPHERVPEFLREFLAAPCPVDVIVLTVDELRAMEAEGRRFAQTVRREAMVLAGDF